MIWHPHKFISKHRTIKLLLHAQGATEREDRGKSKARASVSETSAGPTI